MAQRPLHIDLALQRGAEHAHQDQRAQERGLDHPRAKQIGQCCGLGRVQHHAFGPHTYQQGITVLKAGSAAFKPSLAHAHRVARLGHGGQQIHAAHKTGRKVADRLGVKLLGRALLLDTALVHQHHAVGHGERFFLVVRDHHAGNAQLALQLADFAAQLGAHLGIERGQRLVQQQQTRAWRQCAGQRNALLLATRQLRRIALRLRTQTYQSQHLLHPGLHLRRRLAPETKRHILGRRQVRKQCVALEHHAKASARGGPARDVLALKQSAARVGLLDAAQNAQQRGLAAARRAQQADELAALHQQANVAQHRGVFVLLGDMFYAQHLQSLSTCKKIPRTCCVELALTQLRTAEQGPPRSEGSAPLRRAAPERGKRRRRPDKAAQGVITFFPPWLRSGGSIRKECDRDWPQPS